MQKRGRIKNLMQKRGRIKNLNAVSFSNSSLYHQSPSNIHTNFDIKDINNQVKTQHSFYVEHQNSVQIPRSRSRECFDFFSNEIFLLPFFITCWICYLFLFVQLSLLNQVMDYFVPVNPGHFSRNVGVDQLNNRLNGLY